MNNNMMTTLRGVLLLPVIVTATACSQSPLGKPLNWTSSPYATGVGQYLRGAVSELDGGEGAAVQGYLGSLAEDPDNLGLRLRSFNLALLANDVPTALRLARTLPDGPAQQTMPQLVLSLGALAEGKTVPAQPKLQRLATMAPEVLQFQALLQQVRVANGIAVEEGVKALQALELPEALEGRRQYQIARLWLRAGKTDKAIAALEHGTSLEPGAVFGVVLLGQIYERQGQPDKAVALYRDFKARNPASGLLSGEAERVQRGEMPALPLATPREDAATTVMDFALLLWAQGAIGPARQLVNMALWLDPRDPWLAYYGGIVEEFGGNMPLARARYVQAETAPGLAVAAGIRQAELAYRDGDTREALRDMDALVRRYGNEMAPWSSRGEMNFDQRKFGQSADDYAAALRAAPQDIAPELRAKLMFAQGASLEQAGRPEEAAAVLQQALALDPANAQVLNYLGYMWVEQGKNLDEAFALLKRAMALAPNDGAITDSMGWAYYMRGDYEEAVVYLERAAELEPDDATVTAHLGDVYAKLGRKDEARQQWQRALELTTENEKTLKKDLKAKLSGV